MATRTIVTSQPDVECDVCERRLLRGEQPDVFLAAGRRRIVCELCAPRAAHEGWMRESDSQSLSLPPMRARRGRSLFDRLRQVGGPRGTPTGEQPGEVAGLPPAGAAEPGGHASYGLFDGYASPGAEPLAPSRPQAHEPQPSHLDDPGRDRGASDAPDWRGSPLSAGPGSETGAVRGRAPSYVEQAIAVFNASEFPRRVAGVARSLGAPVVNVRSAEHLSAVVSIVIAWELCWYRYEIDLSEPVIEARAVAQGTELGELAREDRQANAHAAESGTLALSSV